MGRPEHWLVLLVIGIAVHANAQSCDQSPCQATTVCTGFASINCQNATNYTYTDYCYVSGYCVNYTAANGDLTISLDGAPPSVINPFYSVIKQSVMNAYNAFCNTSDNYKLCCPGAVSWANQRTDAPVKKAMESPDTEVLIPTAKGAQRSTTIVIRLAPNSASPLCSAVDYPSTATTQSASATTAPSSSNSSAASATTAPSSSNSSAASATTAPSSSNSSAASATNSSSMSGTTSAPSGAMGASGTATPSGASGSPGTAAPSGASGSPGTAAPSGASGSPGTAAPSGASGSPSTAASPGAPGDAGSVGSSPASSGTPPPTGTPTPSGSPPPSGSPTPSNSNGTTNGSRRRRRRELLWNLPEDAANADAVHPRSKRAATYVAITLPANTISTIASSISLTSIIKTVLSTNNVTVVVTVTTVGATNSEATWPQCSCYLMGLSLALLLATLRGRCSV